MTILVADDESESRQLLVDILKAEGYEARPADNGQLALAAVMAQPPDLILLDIRMPHMDGFEVCPGIFLFCISATAEPSEEKRSRRGINPNPLISESLAASSKATPPP